VSITHELPAESNEIAFPIHALQHAQKQDRKTWNLEVDPIETAPPSPQAKQRMNEDPVIDIVHVVSE
jgi:hypothetical protein